MSFKIFITGTDTGIGKTYISLGLLKAFQHLGYSAIGIKPVASGGFKINNNLYNQDALDLNQSSYIQLDYQHTNPFLFEPPIAPHIAAAQAGLSLTAQDVILKSNYALSYPCDIHITEGIGGWSVPLNGKETMIDVVSFYRMNILLVVGMRLGCINHAMLTYQAIKQANLPMLGWLANCFEVNNSQSIETIAALQDWLGLPYLGSVPYRAEEDIFLKIASLIYKI